MIKSLSPYYINVPFVSPLTGATCSSFTLKIYVWDGLKLVPPASAVYQVTKNNPTTSVGSDKLNIGRLVNDFIEFLPKFGGATGLYNAQNQRWCKTTITYTTANALDLNVEQLPTTALVLKGYGYGMEGENTGIPQSRILLNGNEFKVNRNGIFNIPIILDMTLLERVEALELQTEALELQTEALELQTEALELKVPKNKGYFDAGNIVSVTVNYPVGGDIVSATKTGTTALGDIIQCTMANAMPNTNYKVIISPQSLTSLELDNEIKPPVFRIDSTTQFSIYLEETSSVAQNIRIHLDVVQL